MFNSKRSSSGSEGKRDDEERKEMVICNVAKNGACHATQWIGLD